MDRSEKKIKEIIENSLPVVVWGFGGMISFIVNNLRQYGVNISFIVDNDSKRWGSFFEGIEIISFEKLKSVFNDCNILIGVCTKTFVSDIKMQIQEDGQFKKVFFFEMFYPFGRFAKNVVDDNKEKINLVRSWLSDQKSQLLYEKKVQYILTKESGMFDGMFDPEYEQYFDKGLIDLNHEKGLFIDGGAYHGENTQALFERFPGTELQSVCIDPDETNVKMIKKRFENEDRVRVRCAALSEKSGVVKFEYSGSRGGCINSTNGVDLDSIGIDDEFSKQKVRFIKLDIEGAEMSCLCGAKDVIRKEKPILAICIYHSIEDHFDIPIFIKNLRPDYKLYVRQYHYTGIETVLYAI